MMPPSNQISLFLSYAHEDEPWLKRLLTHLSMLKRQGIISTWYDRRIVPGTNWARTIDQRLEQASLILLLVSADFLDSDYCYDVEMQRALQLHASGQARVIPIAIRPVDWTGAPFAGLQALPTDAKSLSTWSDVDSALLDVVAGIRRAVEDLAFSPASSVRRNHPIWMIPYPRNLFFLGRDAILEQLHTHLHSGQNSALSPSAICGLGGIGKTQIAIEYAYLYHQEYTAVFWARAQKYENLLSAYIDIATRLRLPECVAKEQDSIIAAVQHWLQTNQHWLLILDNADDLDLVPPFLPPNGGGHILITTRASDMQRLARPFDVEPLSDEQGAILLAWRAGLLATAQDGGQLSQEDHSVALSLTRILGGLPLALDQAGAYMEAATCSLQEYQELYQTHQLALFQERRSYVADHPEGVMTTWLLSFQQIQEQCPAAADLLRFCAFCAPDAIAEEMLTAKPEAFSPLLALLATDMLQRLQAIEALRTYSLIQRDPREKMLSIHRVVQAVFRGMLKKEEQCIWAEQVLHAINAAFPRPEHATWSQCERLLVQALSATELIEQYHLITQEARVFLRTLGRYLADRARYMEAEPLYQRALRMMEESLGPEHPDVASLLNGLAGLYREQGKYMEAEPLYQRALWIREKSLGFEHPQVASSLNNLAELYREQGKYVEVESLYQRALRIREKCLGPEHPDVASSLNGLAGFYREQKKYVEAEQLYQRALWIREECLGPEHLDVTSSLNGLVILYAEQRKYVEAEQFCQRALRIREECLGSEHPDVAYPLSNLAILYAEQGKYMEAEPLYQRALWVMEESLGSEHPQVAYPLNNLAILYVEQGKYMEAEPLYQQALRIMEESLGPEHPDVASALSNLAILYAEQGKYMEAEQLYQRALRIKEESLGLEHPQVASSLNGLTGLYREQEKCVEAELLYQRALWIMEECLGSEHPQVA